jgi:5-methylcytosine-specific restriction endonuclease McrA
VARRNGTEQRLLAVGKASSACQVERIVRGWRRVDQIAEAREDAHRHESRALQVYQDADGMAVVRGRLTPEQGAVLMRALEAACEALHRRGDVSENIPSSETSRRLACDATPVVMWHDADKRTVEVGARTRTIPPALRRALQHRDRGCRFPGCEVRFGQGHHICHWVHGGPTTLWNLVMLCRRHHRAVHEEGYQLEQLADGTLRFRTPNGWALPDAPPLPALPQDPVATLKEQNDTTGIRPEGRSPCATALWEPLDVGWAIDVLHPRALAPSAT